LLVQPNDGRYGLRAMTVAWTMLVAVLVDAWLGEPSRAHPLVGFGRLVRWIESRLYADRRGAGVGAWLLAVTPLVVMAWYVDTWLGRLSAWAVWVFNALVLYAVVGLRSLGEHATPVASALRDGDIARARRAVGWMVSRDTQALDEHQVAAAATESVLENGSDAVFGALFWFAVLGAPGALLYRLANTLDAMWGYRTERYENFGWAAARIDDGLNFIPARLTALSYMLLGRTRRAFHCWRTQAKRWDSPNAGPVMASGAGALGVKLGGAAPYAGVWESRPNLGKGDQPDALAIERSLALVRRSVVLWLTVAFLCGGLTHA
jgi:adenosylcobinamide-phosphate synthase